MNAPLYELGTLVVAYGKYSAEVVQVLGNGLYYIKTWCGKRMVVGGNNLQPYID